LRPTVARKVPGTGALPRGLMVALAAAASLAWLGGCAGPAAEGEGPAAVPLASKTAQPLAAGKARIVLERSGTTLYSGVPATVSLNNQKVADLWAGGGEVVDVAPGKAELGVGAWTYTGTYRLEIDAKAGEVYRVAIAPRGESFGAGLILGPFGGLIDQDEKGNSGAFKMELAATETAKVQPMETAKAPAKPSGATKAKKKG
jgi:hypothetical protein